MATTDVYMKNMRSVPSFELLLADISAWFVNLASDQLDNHIENALKAICKYLGIDLSALWQWSENPPHFLTIIHPFSPPKGSDRPEDINAEESIPWILDRALHSDMLVVQTEEIINLTVVDENDSRIHYYATGELKVYNYKS